MSDDDPNADVEAAPMCFACGKENPVGPQVGYHVDGDTCTAELVDRIEAEYGNARRWLRVA